MFIDQVQHLNRDAAALAAAPLWQLSDDELCTGLQAAHRLQQSVAVLETCLIRQACHRGVPSSQGHRDTATWLRALLKLDSHPARELDGLVTALGRRPAIEQALLDGHADTRQAAVIASCVDTVASELAGMDDVSPAEADEITARAESTLIEMAERFPAVPLRTLGGRIMAHVAPEVAERNDEQMLIRQEARAHAARKFTLSAPIDGMVHLSGILGSEDAALVKAALDPLCKPLPGDQRSPAARRADALAEVCRLALRTNELPESGGEPAQLAVTVGFDPLIQALGIATTDSGERLSAETARRLACDAQILPVVLGGACQVLDVGRARRLATGSLRRALTVRDRGCAFPDCERQARWCDAHHLVGWDAGGATALDNLVLLCRVHHRLLHHPMAEWEVRLGADRMPEFIPPPHIDPSRQPRRNMYHPRR